MRSRRARSRTGSLELEGAGLLERRVIDARPPRVEYVLTDEGHRLRDVLDALAAYAAR